MLPASPRMAIVLMSALGDVILGVPVAAALRRAFPGARLTWVVQRGPDAVVRASPHVDDVVLFDRRGGLAGYQAIGRALSARRLDVVLDLQVALKAGLVTWLSRAPLRIGVDRHRSRDANVLFTTHQLPRSPRAHMADQHQEFLRFLGIAPGPLAYDLMVPSGARVWAEQVIGDDDRPLVAVVLASSHPDKNWMPDRLAAVCVALARDFGARAVLCGATSPTEVEARARITAACRMLPERDRPIDALGSGIPNLMGLLSRAALVISPDTGPLHLAGALGRPVVGLYATTNPKWVGPYRHSADLLVDRYGEPGEEYPSSSRRRPGRMPCITVDDVLERVDRWRARVEPVARPLTASAAG